MATILVADDDGYIREVVRFALESAGHDVLECADGVEALETLASHSVDAIVLDIVMPEKDGLDVCRAIRARSDVPILFLSSRDDEIDRVLGLEIGADDYVTKPFSPRELVARVKTILRRAGGGTSAREEALPPLRWGELTLDPVRYRCTWKQQAITLTVTEFALLQALMGDRDRVYARSELVDRAWGYGHALSERTVDSHIRRLRKKLSEAGADLIETVYGVGYRLAENAPREPRRGGAE